MCSGRVWTQKIPQCNVGSAFCSSVPLCAGVSTLRPSLQKVIINSLIEGSTASGERTSKSFVYYSKSSSSADTHKMTFLEWDREVLCTLGLFQMCNLNNRDLGTQRETLDRHVCDYLYNLMQSHWNTCCLSKAFNSARAAYSVHSCKLRPVEKPLSI